MGLLRSRLHYVPLVNPCIRGMHAPSLFSHAQRPPQTLVSSRNDDHVLDEEIKDQKDSVIS